MSVDHMDGKTRGHVTSTCPRFAIHAGTLRLGVNIDHVATLRQARGGREPDPVRAALLAELGGADGITVHLREDRRHIQDRDLRLLAQTLHVPLNLELASAEDVVALALELRPYQATLVPERREELTTEGGLDVAADVQGTGRLVARLASAGVRPALFIDPDVEQVRASVEAGALAVELHTGAYAEAWLLGIGAAGSGSATGPAIGAELERLRSAAALAVELGLAVHAGHGLNYHNVRPVAAIPRVEELNIGHSIVSRAVYEGLKASVADMRRILDDVAAAGGTASCP